MSSLQQCRAMEHLDRQALLQWERGELPPEEAQECARHVADCEPCRALSAEVRAGAQPPDPSEDTPALTPRLASALEVGPAHLARGSGIGRYLVLEKLGQGGMGEVYAAFDPQLNRRIALKLLLPAARDAEGHAKERLLREAQAMARLSHPNVLPVHDAGEFEGRVFIAMELVEGQNLRQWLRESARPWPEVLRVFLEAGRGLGAAHAAGLVHRDFKPDNVLVGYDGRVHVMDFGLARAGDEHAERAPTTFVPAAPAQGEPARSPQLTLNLPTGLLSTHLTQHQAVIGTPGYMAPEQVRNEKVDGRADLFSFCAALYAGLYGQKAFGTGSARDILAATLAGEVQPPPRDTRVPTWLHRVLLKGLAVEREQRYPDMEALLSALQADPWVRRRRVALAAGLALVVAGGVGAWRYAANAEVLACESEARALDEAWGSTRAEEVQQAFLATGKPYARRAFEGLRHTLDGYAAAWRAQRTDACLATRVRGEASAKVLALRSGCLADRQRELRALTELFARADAQVVERAASALGTLPSLEACADVDELGRALPPPAGEAARRTLETLQQQLAHAGALHGAGKYPEALAEASAALEAARTLAWAPLTAQALYEVGRLQLAMTRTDEAAATLKQALWAAEELKDDALKARVLARLAAARAVDARTVAEAHDWFSLGRATAAHLKTPQRVQAELHGARGRAFVVVEDFQQGERELRLALAQTKQGYGAGSIEVAQVTNELAHALFMQGRYEQALPLREEALAVSERVLGPDHPVVGMALGALGMTLNRLGRPEEAIVHLQRSLALFGRALPEGHRHNMVSLNNAAIVLKRLGRVEEALAYYQRALALYERTTGPETRDIVTTRYNIGEALRSLGRLPEARDSLQRAHATAEKVLPPTHSLRSDTLEGLAQVELASGRPQAALSLVQRSLKLRAAAQARPESLGDAHFLLARAQWALGARAEAQAAVAAARRHFTEAGSKSGLEDLDAWAQKAAPVVRR